MGKGLFVKQIITKKCDNEERQKSTKNIWNE